jgi:hypothetical protein
MATAIDYSRFTSAEFHIDREMQALINRMVAGTITPHEKARLDYLQRLRVWLMTPRLLQGPKPQPPLPPTQDKSLLDSLRDWRRCWNDFWDYALGN